MSFFTKIVKTVSAVVTVVVCVGSICYTSTALAENDLAVYNTHSIKFEPAKFDPVDTSTGTELN